MIRPRSVLAFLFIAFLLFAMVPTTLAVKGCRSCTEGTSGPCIAAKKGGPLNWGKKPRECRDYDEKEKDKVCPRGFTACKSDGTDAESSAASTP